MKGRDEDKSKSSVQSHTKIHGDLGIERKTEQKEEAVTQKVTQKSSMSDDEWLRKHASRIEYFINKFPDVTFFLAKGKDFDFYPNFEILLNSFPPELGARYAPTHDGQEAYPFIFNAGERAAQFASPGYQRQHEMDSPKSPYRIGTLSWETIRTQIEKGQHQFLPKSDFCTRFDCTMINLTQSATPPEITIVKKFTDVLSITDKKAQEIMQGYFDNLEVERNKLIEGIRQDIAKGESKALGETELAKARREAMQVQQFWGIPSSEASSKNDTVNILAFSNAYKKWMENSKNEMQRQRELLHAAPGLAVAPSQASSLTPSQKSRSS